MDPRLFSSDAAGKLITVGQGDTAYWAFIPNPLPPDIPPDWSLTCALSLADRALSELAGLGRTLANPKLFIHPFLRREAVLSSRIEGTRSELIDLYIYRGGQLTLPGIQPAPPEDDDLREVDNYVRALDQGIAQLEDTPIRLWVLRGLHKTLLDGVRGQYATPGQFRTSQNWIGGSTINNAIYVPPPVIELEPALLDLERYFCGDANTQQEAHAHVEYPPLVKLAMIHYQFEAIHPFVDGNGRIGRLLLSLLLVSWKLLPLPLLHLSAYIEPHRQEYYELLLAVSQKGAWYEWLAFFMRAVTSQAQDTIARIKRIQDLQQDWHTRLLEARASSSAIRLADSLLKEPIITIPVAQKSLNMTYTAVERAVSRLIELGILAPQDDRRYDRTFIARDLIEIILKPT